MAGENTLAYFERESQTQKKSFKTWKRQTTIFISTISKQNVIEQVASNKSSLLLKIPKLNTQTLQVFTKIIKMESIYKSN
jgi:hypothetical protein